jgi:hypothetical protein
MIPAIHGMIHCPNREIHSSKVEHLCQELTSVRECGVGKPVAASYHDKLSSGSGSTPGECDKSAIRKVALQTSGPIQ